MVNYLTRIEVIATEGRLQKRILWVDARKNGVYLGYCFRDMDAHISYHVDGKMFQTVGSKATKMGDFQPLTSFKNTHQLAASGFTTDLSKLRGLAYSLKRLDAVVYLDMRAFRGNFANCLVQLLEPQRFDLLMGSSILPGVKQIEIFTSYNPWIVVSILDL